jgi:hypothetical protein
VQNPAFTIGAGRGGATAGLVCATMPESSLHSRFSQIPRLEEKTLLEGAFVRKRVYNLNSRKAKESIPAKGGEKRCLAMAVGS